MEKLEALASVTRLSENVVRILGQNPGKFTLQGTNTYLVGKHNPYTLIDTGEGREEYIPILESTLTSPANPDEPDVSDIIISHWHPDHVGGIPGVLTMLKKLWDATRGSSAPYKPPKIHKFPLPANAKEAHERVLATLAKASEGSFTPSPSGEPFHELKDAQVLSLSSGIRVLHTPGHTLDSICLYIPFDKALYTADTVLGQGTAVFENLKTYIESLRKMHALEEDYDKLYPGHGPVNEEGRQLIQTYIDHRLQREAQILEVLKKGTPPPHTGADASSDADDRWTTWTLVKSIYAAYPESLWLPATRSVELHLLKLEEEGIVERLPGEEGVNTRWLIKEERLESHY